VLQKKLNIKDSEKKEVGSTSLSGNKTLTNQTMSQGQMEARSYLEKNNLFNFYMTEV
jgi:hypothetical protein